MRRTKFWLSFTVLLVLSLTGTAWAQLDVAAPFLNQEVGDYYIKARVLQPAGQLSDMMDLSEIMVKVYSQGDLTITKTEVPGQTYTFAMQETWMPETDLALFYANYEVRIVGTEEILGRRTLAVELIHKLSDSLREKYLIDQETGLVLNKYTYDQAGNLIQGFEAVAVDFEPDFSTLDAHSIPIRMDLEHKPLSKEAFAELLPWLNLDNLPLPEGYGVVAYSEATSFWHRENPFFKENYPDLPVGAYWLWVSDGFEAFIIEVFAAADEEIVVTRDSYWEVVVLPSGAAIVVLAGQPATIEVQASNLAGQELAEILLSLTGAREIKNLEALGRDPLLNLLGEQEFIDYVSLPREPVTKEEFVRLNPWIRLNSAKEPAGFTVTGIYQVEYPQEIKEKFALHKENSDRELLDFVLELSDGEALHYISVSFAPGFHRERMGGSTISIAGLNRIEMLANGPLFSIYSESSLLSEDEQLIILGELFPGFGFMERPVWEPPGK